MYDILIKQPGEQDRLVSLVPGSYRVGSSPAAHLQFKRPEISGKHALLIVSDDEVRVCDQGSSNGTYVNGRAATDVPVSAPPGAVVMVGRVEFHIKGPKLKAPPQPPPAPTPTPPPIAPPAPQPPSISTVRPAVKMAPEKPPSATWAPPSPPPLPSALDDLTVAAFQPNELGSRLASAIARAEREAKGGDQIPVLRISGIPEEARPLVQEIKRQAHIELLKRLNLKRMAVSGTSDNDLKDKARQTIHDIMSEITAPLPYGVSREKIEVELLHEAIGLGPLEELIEIDEISEIMVNGPNQVYVERKGILYRTDTAFAGDYQVQAAIERIVSPLGRRIDESSPMVDARLPDGSRVNAIIPPLSLIGPSITIRKFSRTPLTTDDYIRFGSLNKEIIEFLRACVQLRKNIIISGGTGSGKTTLLNVLSSFLPYRERIVTIEDAAELQLKQDHVVRLEARPPNIEGKGAVTIRDLVRNSLRMRPDRIVVGECRGGEALDMLQAMNTGHDGSMTTIHANTPRDALARLETLVLMAGFDLPLRAIREQVCSAIDVIVQISRMKDGSRKLTHVSEITKMEGDIITMQDIFIYKQLGWSPDGKVLGRHVGCGAVPTFFEDVTRARIPLDIKIFNVGQDGVY